MQDIARGKESIPFHRNIIFIVIIIVFFIAIITFILLHTVSLYTQKGNMMSPIYKNGATLLIIQSPFSNFFLQRGSVVLFKEPLQPYGISLMRIVGLPDEKIMLESGSIYIDQAKLDETPYLHKNVITYGEPYLDDGLPRKIPANMYAVMGDNRQFSADSRTWGFVPKTNILGVIPFCVFHCR